MCSIKLSIWLMTANLMRRSNAGERGPPELAEAARLPRCLVVGDVKARLFRKSEQRAMLLSDPKDQRHAVLSG
jgi:hypothetical protein